MTRTNPDERFRRIERDAAAGDPRARRALERERERTQQYLTYHVWIDDGGPWEQTIEAASLKDAMEEAEEQFGADVEERDETQWFRARIWSDEQDEDGEPIEQEEWTLELEPDEPDCFDQPEHVWETVDGPRGHGGGVSSTEQCRHCSWGREIDTWHQSRETGEVLGTLTRYRSPGQMEEAYPDPDEEENEGDEPWEDRECEDCGRVFLVPVGDDEGYVCQPCQGGEDEDADDDQD